MGALRVFTESGTSVRNMVRLFLRVLIGATGAVGAFTQQWGFGTTPLTRTGVGTYTVSLRDIYPANSLMSYAAYTLQAAVAAGNGIYGMVTAEAYNAANPNLTVVMFAANTQAAAEIANGATLLMEFGFKNISGGNF